MTVALFAVPATLNVVVVSAYPVWLYPLVHVTAHVGVLFETVDVAVPLVIVHTGSAHTAYKVLWLAALAPNATAVPEPLAAVFHPVITFCDAPEPFVILHVELFHDGAAQPFSYEQVNVPAFVLVAPPHVPVPPFLFSDTDLLATVKLYVAEHEL